MVCQSSMINQSGDKSVFGRDISTYEPVSLPSFRARRSADFAVLAAIGTGRDAAFVDERPREVALVVEAAGGGDVRDEHVRGLEQLAGGVDAGREDVASGRHVERGRERLLERAGGHVRQARQLGDREARGEVRHDVVRRVAHGVEGEALGVALGRDRVDVGRADQLAVRPGNCATCPWGTR